VKMDAGVPLIVYGTLSVTGTSAEPVLFTSVKDDSVGGDTNNDGNATSPAEQDWREIFVASTGRADLEHSVLRYGGNWYGNPYYDSLGNLYNEGGIMSLDHITSTLGMYGAKSFGGATTIKYSTFMSNTNGIVLAGTITNTSVLSSTLMGNDTGLLFSATVSPTITGNSIYGNSSWGLNNTAGFTILAENNWWGAASGPTHASNPGGSGDKVSDYVDFTPWLTVIPLLMGG
jgi:hypothetical protein